MRSNELVLLSPSHFNLLVITELCCFRVSTLHIVLYCYCESVLCNLISSITSSVQKKQKISSLLMKWCCQAERSRGSVSENIPWYLKKKLSFFDGQCCNLLKVETKKLQMNWLTKTLSRLLVHFCLHFCFFFCGTKRWSEWHWTCF